MFTLCPSRHPWASIDCTEWAVSQGSSTPSPLESSHRENGAPVLCLVPWSRKVVGGDAIPMLAPDSGIWHHRRKKKRQSGRAAEARANLLLSYYWAVLHYNAVT